MKRRFTLNEIGELADRDGNVLGRVVALTLEFANSGAAVGTTGLRVFEEKQNQEEDSPVVPASLEPPAVRDVWAFYEQTFPSHRQKLNPQKRRIIENALKVRDVERCCEAIVGLSRSPHHNGQNDQGIKYLDIRYALKGNSRAGESIEERIDRMAALASSSPAPTGVGATVTQARIEELKAQIRRLCPDPRYRQPDENELARRNELIAQLAIEHDITTTFQSNGYPRFGT